jgi:hypothetical protein
MAIYIKQKRSTTPGSIPTTGSLGEGELAVNVSDGKIYLRKSGSGVDTVVSAITTETSNSGSLTLTGSINLVGSGSLLTMDANSLELTGSLYIDSGYVQLDSITDPSAPPTGSLIIYSKEIAGRILPKWIGPSGVDTPFQPNMMFNQFSAMMPGGGTTLDAIGCTITNVGTISNPTLASTNLRTQTRRVTNTSAAAAGSLASTRVTNLECWRGNATGFGGFFVVCRFGLTTLQTGMRAFFGLTDTAPTAPTNIDPTTSTTPGKIGMAINASTGNWSLVNNITGTSPTVLALGANYPVDVSTMYEFILFAKPNDTVVKYRITNMTTGAQTTGSLSTNIPSSTTFLGRTCWATNNATAAAVAWDLSRFSLESDY